MLGLVFMQRENGIFGKNFSYRGRPPALPVVRYCRKKGYGVEKRLSGEALWKICPDVLGW